jgi:heptosyltransferase-1
VTSVSPVVDMQNVERLLVIKMSALGDVARTVPTVDAIRKAYPHVKIGWVVRNGLADLLVGNPSIDELFIAPRGIKAIMAMWQPIRRFRPDVTLDMQGLFISGCLARLSGASRRFTWESGREFSGLLTGNPIVAAPEHLNAVECLFNFARLLGVERLPEEPPAYLTRDPALIARAEELLEGAPSPRIGMHIGASVPNKTWPPSHWARLADRFLEAGYSVILFGGKAEATADKEIRGQMKGRPLSLVGCTTPRELAAAISRCDLFLGGDTGATHIASLVGTPIVALMGPTDPKRFGPYGAQNTTLHLGLSCSPCYRHPTCHGRYDCMRGIEPDWVYRVCRERLKHFGY